MADARLLAAYQRQVQRVREQVLAQIQAIWVGVGSYRDSDVDRIVALLVPKVRAGQVQVANLTAAYIARIGGEAVTVDRDLVTGGRGVVPESVYARPIEAVWTALGNGALFPEAVEQGATRLASLAATDMQMAKVRQFDASLKASDFTYYRRVLTGRENCALCVIASTQRYRVGDLSPIHPGCDCGVEPVTATSDPGRVLDRDLLEQTYAATRPQLQAAIESGSPKQLRDLIVTREHGEYGPTLSWRTDQFTGPGDRAA